MNKIEICNKIKNSIRKLMVFDGEKAKSYGTAIVINDSGLLLTANHVISKYSKLANHKLLAYGLHNIPEMEYEPTFNFSIDIGEPDYFKPLQIDLAILNPLKSTDKVEFIELEDENALEGTDVIMAGFPDEVHPPLNFDKMLNFENPELFKNKEQIENFFEVFIRMIFIKGGMIGSAQRTVLNCIHKVHGIEKQISVEGAVYWIDNSSNHGASGGPVVNSSGKLVGIISEMGLTTHQVLKDVYLDVPSGATMALSHKLITWSLDN